MNFLHTIVNVLGQNALRRKRTFRWFRKVEVLLAEVWNELHEGTGTGADGRGRRYQVLDLSPLQSPYCYCCRQPAAILSICEAVLSPVACPPRTELIGGAQLLKHVADVVDQE